MVHVILDTNIFSSNRRRDSGPFHALARLCHGRKAKLYVPYVVKHEFLSQQREHARKLLDEIRGSAGKLTDLSPQGRIVDFATDVEAQSAKLRATVDTVIDEEWESWMKHARAIQDPIHPSHGERVMEDYFAGKPPYKAAKSRNDIPDSYLMQAILDLARQFQMMHLVTNDKAVSAAAAEVQGIVLHDKLASFIQLEACQQALQELAESTVAKNIGLAETLLLDVKDELTSAMNEKLPDALMGNTVVDRRIPDESHEGMIYLVEEPSELEFDFEKVDYYGDSEIGIPFEAIAIGNLNYTISKADFYQLDKEKAADISITERNDHYFDADEEYAIRVIGKLQIKLDRERLRGAKTDVEIRGLFEVAEYKLNVDKMALI